MSKTSRKQAAKEKTSGAPPPARNAGGIILWAGIGAIVLAGGAVAGFIALDTGDTATSATMDTPVELASDTSETDVDSARPTSELVTKVESLYNDIYLYRQSDGNYMLSFGAKRLRYVESIVNPNDELELPVYYTQSMTVGLAYPDKLESAAIIGLGGGRTAWYVHKSIPDLKFTAVELDPEVAKIADRYFNVRSGENFEVAIRDGRVHLSRNDETFDLIFVDAYRGPFVPFHLLTREFYELVGERLEPGGVAVQNVEPTTMLFDAAVATIGAAFDHLEFYEGRGNIVIVAYNGEKKSEEDVRAQAATRQTEFGLRYDLNDIIKRRFEPEWNDDTEPLTDDWAPVEYLKAVQRHNKKQT